MSTVPPPPSDPPPPPTAGDPSAAQNGMGTAALILSILGLVGCIPFIGSILGIVLGKIGMRNAAEGRANNGGVAKAGFIIGIISLILWVVFTIIYLVFFVWLVSNNPEMMNQ
jgi:K+ transporter